MPLRFLTLLLVLTVTQQVHGQSDPGINARSIFNSPHNMSASGKGQFRSLSTSRVCVFCHTPHSPMPNAPMWNRSDTGQSYIQYSSSSLVAVPGQPSGSSRLCLACHDGTVALDQLSKLPNEMAQDKARFKLAGRSNLGTDLADDHPISFRFDHSLQRQQGELLPPEVIDLPMDDGIVRCGSCHDPHDNSIKPFLHLPSTNGQLCTACHAPAGNQWNWELSTHAISDETPKGTALWQERKPQWRGQTIAENSCFNCHAPHNATTPERLMTGKEEETCYRCHDGSLADDLQSEFLKPSRHPVGVTPNPDHLGEKAEDPLRMALHAECGDCHNAHAVRPDQPMVTLSNVSNTRTFGISPAPLGNALIAGVQGLTSSGMVKEDADHQYEVCFKCHGVPGRSACDNNRCSTARGMAHTRVDGTYNLRDKVDPNANPRLRSYHPIVQNNPFNNGDVPSLRTELGLNTTDTLIYCTDCHNSDESSAGTGAGTEGPHGSIYRPILAERYTLRTTFTGLGSASTEADLCFKCHDESQLRGSGMEAGGSIHSSHETAGSCITCHDPHGSTAGKHLLNFGTNNNLVPAGDDPRITGAGGYSDPTWIETPNGGECWLNCHNSGDHLGAAYPDDLDAETQMRMMLSRRPR